MRGCRIASDASSVPLVSLSAVPATAQQRRTAFAVAVVLLMIFCISAPFANVQLPEYSGYLPAIESIVLVNDFITAILLFSQYSVSRSSAILALASGYFYTALIVIPHMLTFPDAFTPTGLLGAGPQTSAWLYYLWGAGPPLGAIAYACLRGHDRASVAGQTSARSAICWSVALVGCLVLGIVWITTVENRLLPTIVGNGGHYVNAVAYIASPLAIFVMIVAIAMLWIGRRSVLDYWLMLAIFALILQHIYGGFLTTQRYALGFYASRGFTLVTSMLVLGLLLAETMRLYTRVARANLLLERERRNKLMSLEAVAKSISHEVRQPLAAMTMNSEAALLHLGKSPSNVVKAQALLSNVVADSQRASELLQGIHAVFGSGGQNTESVDVNELALGSLRSFQAALTDGEIFSRVELTPELPSVTGHRGQLQEVVNNLVQNAIDALGGIKHHPRKLILRTNRQSDGAIALEVEDSGPGIDANAAERIFDVFTTTKPHGMGLGLAICQTIIERHSGSISVAVAEPRGSIFRVVLPAGGRTTL